MKLRSWKAAVVVAALSAVAAIGSAPRSEAKETLVVKRFLLGRLEDKTNRFIPTGARGTQNAYRDNVIMLVFSAPVDFDSLDNRTVKIGIPATGGLFIDAEGSFYPYVTLKRDESDPLGGTYTVDRVYRNRVLFDPTSRYAPLLGQNPYGLEVDSPYQVTVPGVDSGTTKVVRSTEGSLNQVTFVTTFKTTDLYLQDYKQPRITKVEANDAPSIPLDGRSNVDSRADIIAFFSEPMLPSTFDVNTTFRVFNSGQNRYMSGSIRAAPDGMSFTFRPAYGYGRNSTNIRVTLDASLMDRSANTLDKGVVVNFTTEFDPFAPNYDEINEDFVTTTKADFAYSAVYDPGTWNGWTPQGNTNKDLGLLAGTFGQKGLDISFSSNGGYASPWWVAAVHAQNLYSPAQMGNTVRTISGYCWRHYQTSGRASATTHTVTIQLGHNVGGSLNTNFTGSFSDTPVTVFSGSYSPKTTDIEWINGGAFTANWVYNGKDHVVIDHNQTSGGGVNYWRYTQFGQGGNTNVDNLNGAATLRWNHDIRFYYMVDKSEAQSLWYDTYENNPLWLDPILLQVVPPGTSISVVYQGGRESGIVPNTVDLTTTTAWTNDPANDLPGFRFIRFHMDATSNLGAQTRPTIDQIKLPYIYY